MKKLIFKISTTEKDLRLMCWIPKLHKNHCGARYFMVSKLFSTKQQSKLISSIYTLMYNEKENVHKKIQVFE